MNDAFLLAQATIRSFQVSNGRYYLVDAGFGLDTNIITPWSGQRYHLNDFEASGQPPTMDKELYNLRHAKLRSIVERVFGMLKRKWKIIWDGPAEYSIKD